MLARSRVRLMAADTGLVPQWRGGGFSLVTSLTGRRNGAAVGLMTTDTVLMPGVCFAMRGGVTRRAGGGACFRVMRKSLMTTLASGVAGAGCDERELFLMAALTHRALRERHLEVMRCMTALAAHSLMERALGRRLLVATAASSRNRRRQRTDGMYVVASQATPNPGAFWMV